MTDYNEITDQYKLVKTTYFHLYSEAHTIYKLLGDLKGKSAIDIACGDGYYTRSLKELGAERVVGVDLSRNMIENARKFEELLPLGIEYHVRDIAALEEMDRFDVALAVYFLHYMPAEAELLKACRAIATNLVEEGRLVAALMNPYIPEKCPFVLERFGFSWEFQEPLKDGAKVLTRLEVKDGILDLENYYWSRKTYESILREAGFNKVVWHPLEISQDGMDELGSEYWDQLNKNSPLIFLTAAK
ncbi:MAG: hypothetical protein APR54_07535 [Candidatus Cloacimonas sp. SDB]|nr:MAG: hypothetical protein APR54_07535 [Candidatus Cloacimonas sp. SDB]